VQFAEVGLSRRDKDDTDEDESPKAVHIKERKRKLKKFIRDLSKLFTPFCFAQFFYLNRFSFAKAGAEKK